MFYGPGGDATPPSAAYDVVILRTFRLLSACLHPTRPQMAEERLKLPTDGKNKIEPLIKPKAPPSPPPAEKPAEEAK